MVNDVTLIDPEQFLQMADSLPVIDVRSPGEWMLGHVPGSVNVPLFDNEERAKVGTIYVKEGQQNAIKLGETIAGQKTSYYLQSVQNLDSNRGLLLHCWRGGLRSEKTAAFYANQGYKMFVLKGGYKAYRQYIRHQFTNPKPIIVIGGYTGTGKTEILHELQKQGEQIIDLELLANHRGSIFGHIGLKEQPTTEQFENNLFVVWQKLLPGRITWVEHESLTIGHVYLPDTFFKAMLNNPLIFLEMNKDHRIQRLIDEYGKYSRQILVNSIEKLRPFLGEQNTTLAVKALEENNLVLSASILLDYYDKTYNNSLSKNPLKSISALKLTSNDASVNARELLNFAQEMALLTIM